MFVGNYVIVETTPTQFMAEYEDNELGPADEECVGGGCEASGGVNEYENHLLQSAVENFEKHFRHQVHA